MYFFNLKGKQCLDLRGDLILTHNKELIKTRVKSSAPRFVRNAKYITNITAMGFLQKMEATRAAIAFIWGPSQELTQHD